MSIPLCGKEDSGFKGKIISTSLCAELTEHILRDATKIHISDVKRYNYLKGKHLEPLYTEQDTERAIEMFQGYSYHQKIYLSDKVWVELLPSGHKGGSALIYITYQGEYKQYHLMYALDMYYGDMPRSYTKSIEKKTYKSDVVIIEATYADKPNHSKEFPKEWLKEMIREKVVRDHQQIFIPTFSAQRSTQIIKVLDEIYKEDEEIRKFNAPIYNCGKLTKLCHETLGRKEYEEFYNEKDLEDRDIFDNPKFSFITEPKGVEHFVLNNNPKITLASAGSCNAGFSNMIMESFIPNKTVNLVSCGYVFPESVLDRTIKGDKKVVVNGIGKTKRIKYIGQIKGLSGHADLSGLVSFIKMFDQRKLKKVLIMHGSKEARENLKRSLEQELREDKQIVVLEYGKTLKF